MSLDNIAAEAEKNAPPSLPVRGYGWACAYSFAGLGLLGLAGYSAHYIDSCMHRGHVGAGAVCVSLVPYAIVFGIHSFRAGVSAAVQATKQFGKC